MIKLMIKAVWLSAVVLSFSTGSVVEAKHDATAQQNQSFGGRSMTFFQYFRENLSTLGAISGEELEKKRPEPVMPHYVPPPPQDGQRKGKHPNCLLDPDNSACDELKKGLGGAAVGSGTDATAGKVTVNKTESAAGGSGSGATAGKVTVNKTKSMKKENQRKLEKQEDVPVPTVVASKPAPAPAPARARAPAPSRRLFVNEFPVCIV